MTNSVLFMNRWLLIILFLVFQAKANAQNKVLDSLKAKLEKYAKADTVKANLLKDIGTQLIYINPKSGLLYAARLLDLSKEINQPKFTSNAYRIIAASNNTLGDYKKTVSYAEKALVIDRQLKDNFNQGIDYNIMGVSYQAQGNFVAALPFFQKAITLWEKDKKIAYINMAKTNVAMIYFELKEFDKALAGLQQPLEFYRSNGILYGEGALLTNIGSIYLETKDYEKAKNYFIQSRDVNIRARDKNSTATAEGNIGLVLTKLGKHKEAKVYVNEAIRLYTEVGNPKGLAYNYLNAAEIDLHDKNLPQALLHAQKSLDLAKKTSLLGVQSNASETLSKIYQARGLTDSALIHFKNHVAIRDSILGSQKTKELNRLEVKYEFDKKEIGYKQEQELAKANLEQKELQLALNQSLLDNSLKESDLQKTELRNNQLQRLANEKAYALTSKEKSIAAEKVKQLTQQTELHKLKLKQFWLIGGLALASLLSIVIYIVNKNRIKQLHLKSQLQEEKNTLITAELMHKNSLSESKLTALRSQMNPHFIFNVLNSIEAYVVEEDTEKASVLIQDFAKLTRLVLENSTQSMVTLQKDWTALKLYTALEAMRFNDAFSYQFEINQDLNLEHYLVPPMLMQPLVENAIHHGLRKLNNGDGFVHISLVLNQNRLVFSVEDNGLGLKKAEELKEVNPFKEKSIGLESINARIEAVNSIIEGGNASFSINDGATGGCRAVLELPVVLNNVLE